MGNLLNYKFKKYHEDYLVNRHSLFLNEEAPDDMDYGTVEGPSTDPLGNQEDLEDGLQGDWEIDNSNGDGGAGEEGSSNSNNSSSSQEDSYNWYDEYDAAQALAEAEVEAAKIIAESQVEAAELIRQGQESAAAAIITASENAAAAVLEQAEISDERLREFWQEAKAALEPIIDQGRYASDEIASMLGVKNSDGEIIEFDSQDLRDTPGYAFAEEQGNRALQNSAVGSSLSGSAGRAAIAFGQGLANSTFNTRLEQLGLLAQGGWAAARDQANAATQTGSTYAQVHTETGNNLAGIHQSQGSNLANIHQSSAAQQAQLVASSGQQRAGLVTGSASATTNLWLAEQSRRNNLEIAKIEAGASRSNSKSQTMGTALALFGSMLSDENAKEDFESVDGSEILKLLSKLDVGSWKYKDYVGMEGRHIGPMAQDFSETFGLGNDNTKIDVVDANGVLMASVKELYKQLKEATYRINLLEQGD